MWSSGFILPLFIGVVSFMKIMMGEWTAYSFSIKIFEYSYDLVLMFDLLSYVFLMVVGVVSSSVLLYSVTYMHSSVMKKKFILTMYMFITSMFILSVSSDLFWVMVGWDGLGVTSLCLIMFFQNWKSFNSAMVTFLSNRLGDGAMLVSLVWLISVGGLKSFSSPLFSFFSLMLLIGAFSKSAQIPFSAWLPLAMAAPTPVSSLVHSSTLVTAGVYLLIRFKNFYNSVDELNMLIFIISSTTIFLSAFSSLGEFDLKKIIALSTLSHIGLMMLFVSLSSYVSVLVHLSAHAMFKSLLFMISGELIHKGDGSQDIRQLSISHMNFPLGVSFSISLISMIGFPFFSGFFSKELFISLSSSNEGICISLVFFISAMLTSSYSFRILFSLYSAQSLPSLKGESFSTDWLVFFFMSILSLMAGGVFVSIMNIESSNFYPSIHFFYEKKEIFIFLFFGVMLSMIVSLLQGLVMKSSINWMMNMWWVKSLCVAYQSIFFSYSWFSIFKMDFKGMMDLLLSKKVHESKKITSISMEVFSFYPLSLFGVVLWVLIWLISYL